MAVVQRSRRFRRAVHQGKGQRARLEIHPKGGEELFRCRFSVR